MIAFGSFGLFSFLSERFSEAVAADGCSQGCAGDIPAASVLGGCGLLSSEFRMAC